MTKKIYHYDPITFEFIGETEARESPKEKGVFLIPAYATDLKPKKNIINKVNVFENGEWILKDDYRGQEVERLGQSIIIMDIGVTPESLDPTDEEKSEYEERQKLYKKQSRISEIQSRLNQIDIESIRPIRAIQKGVGIEFDTQKIESLEKEAETLREELRGLND